MTENQDESTSVSQGPVPKAGWYPDNGDETKERYWNGSAWTDQVRNVSADPSGPPRNSSAVQKTVDGALEWLKQLGVTRWFMRQELWKRVVMVVAVVALLSAVTNGISGSSSVIASGPDWHAECQEAYDYEYGYRAPFIDEYVDACAGIAESWEEQGVLEEEIRRNIPF